MNKRRKTNSLNNLKSINDGKGMTGEDAYHSELFIEDPRKLLRRFMPIIGADLIAGCFSIGLVTLLVAMTYFSALPIHTSTNASFIGGMVVAAVFALAKYEVLYGRIHWVWINVAIYLLCLLISLPAILWRPNTYLYALALLGPLVGLLILNSNRCRELRQKSVELRHKREAIIATLKQQGRWKWW
ncbi:hypothetical protein N0U25_26970 [Pseudomonas sivasensis]|uniref:hypothetical protein n=1 Tax=Pseudomonas sivasensis TaxID=1880678 RepID=UPI001F17F29E|nr:hypothetical protein [Pseudomonas sivasensis]MCT4501449.1 hypothetical protein [Pseudomonas sivasensis]